MERTWKQMQLAFGSEGDQRCIGMFFAEEIPDSRRAIRDVMEAEPVIAVQLRRVSLSRIVLKKIKEQRVGNEPQKQHQNRQARR